MAHFSRISSFCVAVGGLAVAVLGAAPAAAQVVPPAPTSLPTPLTLDQALGIALSHQPQQYLARTTTMQALGQKEQVAAQYFPTLTPTYSFQDTSQALYGVPVQSVTVPTTSPRAARPAADPAASGTTTGITTTTGSTGLTTTILPNGALTIVRGGGLSVALSQTLFDSGERELANAQARRALDAARAGEDDTRQQIVLAVTQDYYSLLQALDLVKVAQAQVDRYQQTLDLTKAQVAAGTVAAITISQAQADLATAQVTLLQDTNSVTTASSTLKNAMGVETDAVVQPAPLAPAGTLPPLPSPGPPNTLDDQIRRAYQNRPDLRQQQAVVASDNEGVKAARINAGLSLRSTFTLNYQATNDLGYRGLDTQWLLSGSYPLFDAGRARGEVRSARALRDAALDQFAALRQNIRMAVEQAYSTRAVTYQAARLAQAAVQAAQLNYDSALESRREGVATILDVTTAQATLTQAQVQYVTAVYNFYIADASLQRATGAAAP